MTARSGRRPPRGNALVEFVLVLPLLLALLLGAIDWGWYFTVREIAVNATRQGARVGAAAPSAAAALVDAGAAAQNYLRASLGPAYVVAPTVTPSNCGVAGLQCITVSLPNYPAVPARPASSLSGFIAWTRVPATVTAQTEMRLERP